MIRVNEMGFRLSCVNSDNNRYNILLIDADLQRVIH